MIQNLGSLIKEIKKHLPEYLQEHGINTNSKLFKCPNFKSHKNEDLKPSANFFPDNTSWHCFACEYATKLGDIFDAVHLLEGKDITGENFFEVVKYLCNKYRIPYSEKTSEEERFLQKINQYFELLTNKAHSTLKNLLPKLPKVKKLLENKRWITEIDKFKLGYLNVPFILKGYDDVLAYLNLNPLNIVNRIIIPIIVNNKIVGITTRTIEESSSKYKHFVAYSIKKILFNINNIDKNSPVYIVEGPSSCITLSHFKINNIVATFGNYFHPNQLNVLIKNKIKNIIFLYDGDGGGIEGLRNSLINLSTNEINTKIGFLNDGLDPADYVIKHKNLNSIKIEYLLDYLIKEYSINTQDKYIEKCLMKYINTIEDPVLKEKAISQISKQAKINKSTIGDLLNLYAQNLSGKIADLLKERDSLINTLTTYEKWTWSRGNLLGLKSFKSLDIRLDGIQDGMILVGGKPNIGKCVEGDTLIVTNEGILPISYFASPKQLPNTARPLKVQLPTPLLQGETSHFYYGRSKTIKIRLDNGVELGGTPDHPIAIKKLKSYKMVKLKELKKGDNVLIQVGTNTWGNSLQLPKETQNIKLDRVVKYKPTKIPKYWTPELAYLVGYYLGDGLGTSNTFIIIMNSTYSSYILKIVKNLFGIEMNRKGKYTYVGGNFITNFMRALGISKQKHTNISIPLSILKAPKHIVASFIKGYFLADGYSNKQGEVSFTSASRPFLKELQTILFNFGIISTLKSYKKRATNTTNTKLKVYYTLYVNRRYTNLVKFYRDVLQCDKKVQIRTNTKIKNIIDYTAAFTKTHKYERVIREPYYITSKIKKIERHNKISDVYDFTVPSTHLFLSNGIISHNTLYLNSLALKILQENENVYVLYFTIDDSMYTTISRFIANLSELPINVVSNPNYKINKANLPETVKRDYILRRENALEFLRSKSSSFNIKDGTTATTIEKIKLIIESVIPLTQGKKLVVFIDNLHNLRSERSSLTDRHLYSYISNQINNLATTYQCPIICSVHVTKDAIKNKQFDGSSIKETVELFYDAKLILFVDSDENIESDRDDVELKIYVSKNKQSGFKGILNFIAYKSISKCKEQENSESKLFS